MTKLKELTGKTFGRLMVKYIILIIFAWAVIACSVKQPDSIDKYQQHIRFKPASNYKSTFQFHHTSQYDGE